MSAHNINSVISRPFS